VRKIPAALAVLGLVTVGLAGCSLPGSSECPRPHVSDAEAMSPVSVTGSTDAAPEVQVYTPFHAESAQYEDVAQGDGTAITTVDQLIVIDLAIYSGETGDELFATSYDGDLSQVAPVSQWTQFIPALEDALQCATEGSRVVVALGPDDIEAETAASLGLAEGESSIAVVDLRKVYLAAADGQNQFNSQPNLPSVVRAPDGRPGVVVPDGAAPDEVVVQTLKKGDGEAITGEQPVRVHYTGVTWSDKDVFDSSWETGAVSLPVDGRLPALTDALVGQTVGSQVMVVIPADAGQEERAQWSLDDSSALIFVIDILGLDAAAGQ
jgi:peptidylprolyl isomerase